MKTYFINYPGKVEFSTWPDPIDALPEKNLKKADLILITHHHKDHCKKVTFNRLKDKNTLILAPEMCTKELGKKIKTVKPGEEFNFENIKIKTVEAYNTEYGNSTRKLHHKGNGVGYLITVEGKTIYHAGDTDFIPEMKELGKVDVALIPIGGTFTMDLEEAVEAVITIEPKVVIPMHMKDTDPEEFKKIVEERSNIMVLPQDIGGIYYLE